MGCEAVDGFRDREYWYGFSGLGEVLSGKARGDMGCRACGLVDKVVSRACRRSAQVQA